MRTRITAFREAVWAHLPYLEYVNTVKIALRPRSMIRPDFPMHLNMAEEITQEDTVLEMGANIGGNSKELPRYAKWVHSFEPSPKSFKFLKFNTRRIPNITCYNEAVSGKTETNASFNVQFGGGSLFNDDDFQHKAQIRVPVVGINDLLFPFNTIVSDTEGAEVPIFQNFERWGMVDKIYCETHSIDGHPTKAIVRPILEEHYAEVTEDTETTELYEWLIAKKPRR